MTIENISNGLKFFGPYLQSEPGKGGGDNEKDIKKGYFEVLKKDLDEAKINENGKVVVMEHMDPENSGHGVSINNGVYQLDSRSTTSED